MYKKSLRLSTVALAALILSSSAAYAQAVPSSAEPSRVGGQIAPMPSTVVTTPGAKLSSQGRVSAPAGSDKVKFTLKSVAVDGMTTYQSDAVKSLYADEIGKTVSLAYVYDLAERLTAKYRNEGFVLTQVVVPPQTIETGAIKLRVVEGFIDQVNIEGKTRKDIDYLRKYADKIRAAKPLNAKALERYVLLMNDLSGMSVRAVLVPSPKTPGASDVTLVVDQKAYNFFFQTDNRGSRYLGPFQVNAGVRFNNAFGFYEGLNAQIVTAPEGVQHRELDYFGLNWTQPIGYEGTKVAFGGSVTATEPGFDLTPFAVQGLAHNASVDLTHAFIRSRNNNLYGSVKFNFLNSTRTDNLGLGATEDHVRVLRGGGSWQYTDKYVGINVLTAELSKGLDVFGASDKNDANKTRALGDAQFFKGTLEMSRLQRLSDRFELFASATGQKSANNLLASEEFGVGGVAYGSAYDSSEITGEDGLAARTELRANNLVPTGWDLLQFYGFYDVGKVWDRDNATAKDRQRALASTGLGLRVTFSENFAGSFEYAVPLTRDVDTNNNDNPRAFGSLTAKF